MDSLDDCATAYMHLYVCPAYLFTFRFDTKAECEISLVVPDSRLSSSVCTYSPVSNYYYYYQGETNVTLICKGQAQQLCVDAYYMALDHCDVRNDEFLTLSTHHLPLIYNSCMYLLVNISFGELTIESDKLKSISYLKYCIENKPTNYIQFFQSSVPKHLHRILI